MVGRGAGGALFQWLVEGRWFPVPMVGRGAGGALFQWLVEGLVVPCTNG